MLYMDYIDKKSNEPWRIVLNINGNEISFKIDSGADVSVIPERIKNKLGIDVKIKAEPRLFSADRRELRVLGISIINIVYNGKECSQEFYVVKDIHESLLGRPAIEALELICWQRQIKTDVVGRHPELFKGIGLIKKEFSIKLKGKVNPYSVSVPRRIPIPLRERVEKELTKMKEDGVISPIEKPTDWCAPLGLQVK